MPEIVEKEKQKEKLKEPKRFAVKILNDDFTPMDFVVLVMIEALRVSMEEAERMTMEIHTKGATVYGSYTRDMAETRAALIVQLAQEDGHPLMAEVAEL